MSITPKRVTNRFLSFKKIAAKPNTRKQKGLTSYKRFSNGSAQAFSFRKIMRHSVISAPLFNSSS